MSSRSSLGESSVDGSGSRQRNIPIAHAASVHSHTYLEYRRKNNEYSKRSYHRKKALLKTLQVKSIDLQVDNERLRDENMRLERVLQAAISYIEALQQHSYLLESRGTPDSFPMAVTLPVSRAPPTTLPSSAWSSHQLERNLAEYEQTRRHLAFVRGHDQEWQHRQLLKAAPMWSALRGHELQPQLPQLYAPGTRNESTFSRSLPDTWVMSQYERSSGVSSNLPQILNPLQGTYLRAAFPSQTTAPFLPPGTMDILELLQRDSLPPSSDDTSQKNKADTSDGDLKPPARNV